MARKRSLWLVGLLPVLLVRTSGVYAEEAGIGSPEGEVPAVPAGSLPEGEDDAESPEAEPEGDDGAEDASSEAAVEGDEEANGGARLPVTVFPVESYRLPNGLEVVLQPDRRFPRVSVSVTYRVGERDQPEGLRGIVHVIDGLMFEGSRNIAPGAFDRHLDRAGATERGSLVTADDSTFYEVLPSNHLVTALWLESDRMASLLAAVDAEALERQRRVLANDVALSLSRNALFGLDEAIAEVLYPADHPYLRVGDDLDELSRIELDHVQWFFQRWYSPHNARLALVGDFEVSAVRALVEQYFGPISSSFARPPRRVEPSREGAIDGDRRLVYGSLAPARQVRVIWPTPPFLMPGDAELDDAAFILGRGEPSRLHRRLIAETGLATEVFARQYSSELASYFMIFAEADRDGALEEILEVIDEEVTSLCEEPLEGEEFERAQYLNRARELVSDESLSTRAVSLSRIQSRTAEDGVYRLEHDLERYRAVTPEGVRQSVCQHLPRERRLVVFVTPWSDAPDPGIVVSEEVVP